MAATGALEESQISDCNFTVPSTPRAGEPVLHQVRPGCLSHWGDKDVVGDPQRWCSLAGTMVVSWDSTREIGELGDTWRWEKNWAVMDSDPESLWTGQRVGLCEKPGTC